MNKIQAEALFRKYLKDQCTRHELYQLFKHFGDPRREKELKEIHYRLSMGMEKSISVPKQSEQCKEEVLKMAMAKINAD